MNETIEARARARGLTFGETLPPFEVSARSLWGQTPCHWSSRCFSIREINIPVADFAAPASLVLDGGQGSIAIHLRDIRPYGLYIEGRLSFGDPGLEMRWFYRDGLEGDVLTGLASKLSGHGVWFSTPPGQSDIGDSFVKIQVEGVAPDSANTYIRLHHLQVLAFRP